MWDIRKSGSDRVLRGGERLVGIIKIIKDMVRRVIYSEYSIEKTKKIRENKGDLIK